MKESKLRQLIREETRKILNERPVADYQLESLEGLRVTNVNARGRNITIALSDGSTSKSLVIKGDPEFEIRRT